MQWSPSAENIKGINARKQNFAHGSDTIIELNGGEEGVGEVARGYVKEEQLTFYPT